MIAPETSSSQWKSSVDSKQHETWNNFRVKTSDFQSKLIHQSAKCISKAKIRDTQLSVLYLGHKIWWSDNSCVVREAGTGEGVRG